MSYLYVSASGTLDYTTITEAIADASDGDTLIIDPGTYRENVLLDKHVNLKGNTDTPEDGGVLIFPPDNLSPPLRLNYNAQGTGYTFYFEGIQFRFTEDVSLSSCFTTLAQGSSGVDRASLIFNRCIFDPLTPGGHTKICINLADTYFNRVIVSHCLFKHDGTGATYQFYNGYWSRIQDGQVLACEYESARNYASGASAPVPDNYALTPTVGYGPAYGTYYISIPYGYFEGYVKEQNSAVQRILYLHERDNGRLAATTTSDVTGYYYMETPASGSHYIVCKDDPAAPIYNDLIIGDAYPTAL